MSDDEISRLAAIVEEQQEQIDSLKERQEAFMETVDRLPVSRRRFMQAAAAAGLVGTGAVGGAMATPGDDGDTVWGSDSNRDDYYVDELDANLVNTNSLGVGDQGPVNNWPPVRQAPIVGVYDSSPMTSYQTVTLSSLPSDAHAAIVQIYAEGDGTAAFGDARLRESGTSRSYDISERYWAGHGSFTGSEVADLPVNSNNEIDYQASEGNTARLIVNTIGYY